MNQNKAAAVRRMRGEHGRCTGTHIPPSCFSGGGENELNHSLPICHAHQENRFPTLAHTHTHTQTSTHTPHLGTHSQTQIQTCTHIIKWTNMYKHPHAHRQIQTHTESKYIWIHTQIISELCWHLSPTRECWGSVKQDGQTVCGLRASGWITFILRQCDSPPGWVIPAHAFGQLPY